jgi:hypothetical protein
MRHVSAGLAIVGVALGIPPLFVDVAEGHGYWDSAGHSLGIAMIILLAAAALGAIADVFSADPVAERLWQLGGLTVGGMFLFLPVTAMGSGESSVLNTGAWLGFASCAVFFGAALLTAAAPRTAEPSP